MGEPAMLNTHAHWEQPQPQKFCRSTHTNSRRIASTACLPIWCGYARFDKENQDQEKRHQFGSDIDETVSIHFDSKSLAASFRASITSQKVLGSAVKMSVSFVFNLLLVLVASTVLLPSAF
jgi:hypothetical protein